MAWKACWQFFSVKISSSDGSLADADNFLFHGHGILQFRSMAFTLRTSFVPPTVDRLVSFPLPSRTRVCPPESGAFRVIPCVGIAPAALQLLETNSGPIQMGLSVAALATSVHYALANSVVGFPRGDSARLIPKAFPAVNNLARDTHHSGSESCRLSFDSRSNPSRVVLLHSETVLNFRRASWNFDVLG